MTFRCEARTNVDPAVRVAAQRIGNPYAEIEWATGSPLPCLLEDEPHTAHAAFLRSGSTTDFDSDVYLRWRDGSSAQWIEEAEVCLKAPGPLGTGCTIYRDHPGRCDWAYIDPRAVAAQAQADQLAAEPNPWFRH
ncbi:hypothetical protein AB0912_31530 [Streptomyces sp. NPDC007084]|uniref:hypothetical protein n=1 Tax=Streptomyces sp. NPDC007084 TaxID=3154313 RepID=UPI0034527DD8